MITRDDTRGLVRTLRTVAVGAIAVSWLCACSSFERDWEAYAVKADAMTGKSSAKSTGRWAGEWKSEVNGHHGPLRCLLESVDGEADRYLARFHAGYDLGLTFEYSVSLTAFPAGDRILVAGEENLGWLAGGLYRYEGALDADTFACTYAAESDRGTFRMSRVRNETEESERE